MQQHTPTPDTLRDELEQSLKTAGLKRTACARAAAIDGSNLSKFLNGKRDTLDEGTWQKIAAVLPEDTPVARRFPGARRAPAENSEATGPRIQEFLHTEISPDPANYRKTFDPDRLEGFAEELAADGILQPLVFREVAGKPVIIAGERRWRAVGLAIKKGRWPEDRPLPCILRQAEETEARQLSIIENLQRENVPRLEEAQGLLALRDEFGMTTDTIAKRLGVSKRYVQQALNLVTKLTPKGQALLADEEITFEEARRLWTLPEELQEQAISLFNKGRGDMASTMRALIWNLPKLDDALFDKVLYIGAIVDGRAADIPLFQRLQEAALKETIERLKAKWSAVRTGTGWFYESDFDKTRKHAEGFAYVRISPPTKNRPWTEASIHEGFKARAAKKPQGKDAGGGGKISLTQGQRESAANIKTLALQEALRACHGEETKSSPCGLEVPIAITVQKVLEHLFARGLGFSSASRITLEDPNRAGLPFEGSPVHGRILELLEPLKQKGLFRPAKKSAYADEVFPDQGEMLLALLGLPAASLGELFACTIAATTGTWPTFDGTCGDDPVSLMLSESIALPDLKGRWRLTEDYLTPHKLGGLRQVAIGCGLDPNAMPARKTDAIAWILEHPDRDPDWLPPELHFGTRADVTADVDTWLNPPAAPSGAGTSKPAAKKKTAKKKAAKPKAAKKKEAA